MKVERWGSDRETDRVTNLGKLFAQKEELELDANKLMWWGEVERYFKLGKDHLQRCICLKYEDFWKRRGDIDNSEPIERCFPVSHEGGSWIFFHK